MDRLTLVQGGLAEGKLAPDSSYVLPVPQSLPSISAPQLVHDSLENLRRSIDNTTRHLGGYKKPDLFQSARVDPQIPIEEAVKSLAELVKEGKFDYIGLSECSAETLKRACAVCIFCSPWGILDASHVFTIGTPHCSCRDRSQPVVIRGGDKER